MKTATHETTITVVKGVHSAIFLSMAVSILYTFYSGLTGRTSRLTWVCASAVVGEGTIFLLNQGRCPLTDLVEDLGSERGSVSDIFLPRWFAQRIPILFTPPFALGLAGITVRSARGQPLTAGLSGVGALLFLLGPWAFRPKPRRASDQHRVG
jgi:hypothetical protein